MIDYKQVGKLAKLFCTQNEIAAFLGCSTETLQKDARFIALYKKGIENAKTSVRRAQFLAAKKGNVTMQIWLGKQYLEQRDRQEVTGAAGTAIEIVVKHAHEL